MAEVIKLQGATVPIKGEYALTPTGADAFGAFDLARTGRKIVVVVGPSGCGKSSAISAYTETHAQVATCWVRPSDCLNKGARNQNVKKTLSRIWEATNPYRPLWHENFADINRQLVDRLTSSSQPSVDLIIVDEAQFLDTYSLQTLRCLNQEAGVGLALVGEERLFKLIRTHEQLPALWNRIVLVVQLGIQAADVEAYFDHHGLSASGLKACIAFAKARSWHRLSEAFAKAFAIAEGKAPTHAHLMRALELCGGR